MIPSSPCPFCSSRRLTFLERHRDDLLQQDYGMFACQDCDMQFSDPFRSGTADWYRTMCTEAHPPLLKQVLYPRQSLFFSLKIPGQRVLDVGCGNGRMVYELVQKGFEAEGVDFDELLLAEARRNGLQVSAVDLNASTPRPLGNAVTHPYDIVMASEVLEHLDHPAAFVESLRLSLKPGGYLYLTTPNRNRPVWPFREWFDFPPHHVSRWSCGSMKAYLSRSGFHCVSLQTHDLSLGYLFNTFFYPLNRDTMIKRFKRWFTGRENTPALSTPDRAASGSTGVRIYESMRSVGLGKILARGCIALERLVYLLSWPLLWIARVFIMKRRSEPGLFIAGVFQKL